MADERLDAAVMPGELRQHVGEIGQAGEAAFRDAVRRLVVGDDAEAGAEQRKDEAAHLRRVTAPAVREQHRGRVALAPAPGGDVTAAMLEQRGARINEIERRRGAAAARRRQEQPLGPGAGELGKE